ncbi:MAG TPA: SatD protein [Clostridiaceae bacterium]|nr:SatD protein [Clostridiaceae bacterium]
MDNYLVIIGDLIGSRQIEDKDRSRLQRKIKFAFNEINVTFKSLIVSKLMLTLGDEFQSILKIDSQIFQMIDKIQLSIDHPFRLGIGYGEITTQIDPEFSIGSDGPAFWNARKAVEDVHKNNWNGRCNLMFKGSDFKKDELINTLILNSETLKTMWTETQYQTFKTILNLGIYQDDFIQKDVAEFADISESSLSKRLTKGNIKIYLHTRKIIGKLLEGYHE